MFAHLLNRVQRPRQSTAHFLLVYSWPLAAVAICPHASVMSFLALPSAITYVFGSLLLHASYRYTHFQVTPVTNDDGSVTYQASSPDEVAIVKWTSSVGLTLTFRD